LDLPNPGHDENPVQFPVVSELGRELFSYLSNGPVGSGWGVLRILYG